MTDAFPGVLLKFLVRRQDVSMREVRATASPPPPPPPPPPPHFVFCFEHSSASVFAYEPQKKKHTKKTAGYPGYDERGSTAIVFDTRIITKSTKNFRTVVAYLQRTAIHVF